MNGRASSQAAAGKFTDRRLPHVCGVPRATTVCLTFAALAGVCAVFPVTSARAATSAPAWRVDSVANPTAFSVSDDADLSKCTPYCDKYQVRLTNVGGAASNGTPITVIDTLPAGVTPSGESGNREGEWRCVESTTRVECKLEGHIVAALEQAPSLTIRVQVEPGVPGDSAGVNSVQVEGGGAPRSKRAIKTLLNPSTPLSFGLADFGSYLADGTGAPDTQAAGHPNSLSTRFDVVSALNLASGSIVNPTRGVQDVKDVVVDLPPGFVGDPLAAQKCPLHDLVLGTESSGCPAPSQVAWLSFNANGAYELEAADQGRQNIPVYNMVPERGFPAEFGFVYADLPLLMYASVVGNGANTHVRVSIPGVPASQLTSFQGAVATFFGDPTTQDGLSGTPAAFLTNPSECSGEPLVTTIHVDSWQNQGARNPDGTPDFFGPGDGWQGDAASTPAMEGCGALYFNPSIALTPDSAQAGAPTGLSVDLEVPQSSDPSRPATPDVKQVVVTLPPGMALSPSAANGLGACSPSEIGLENNETPTCPESSKIATVRVKTPLLEDELEGSVYLAQQGNAGPAQGANPFNSLLALYIVIEGSGVVVKLPGNVEANASTGQLTTTFAEDPQLPFSDFKLHFRGGPGAPLSNPSSCGTYATQATLSSWSGQTVQSNTSFGITQGENGSPCPAGQFAPAFTAGTSDNQAGAFSPFTLTFSRQDSEQDFENVSVTMPPGLLGVLKGVAQCPEPQASKGECGDGSLIGEATTAVGPGADPYWVKGGKVYLTGPYNGGPFGLSIVVPTRAGPFELTGNAGLGREVVRASIRVNPATAQITVVSDPLPSILEGIPLQIRTVNVTINRSGFMFNPTNCERLTLGGTISSTAGASAAVSSPFEAANCATLPFAPKLSASVKGRASVEDGTTFDVKLESAGVGQANIRKVDLELPEALPSRLTTLQKACLRATFEENPAACPEDSVVGHATVRTPILNSPLSGPAYLVSRGAKFPDVDFVLQGEGVTLVLDGKTDIKNGVTYSKFETVPDAPFTTFESEFPAGPHSILGAAVPGKEPDNLCKADLAMPTEITGQNGAVIRKTTDITPTGCPPTVTITKAAATGDHVLVTVHLDQGGTLRLSGKGLRTTGARLGAGTHTVRGELTASGRAAAHDKRHLTVRASLTVAGRTGTATTILGVGQHKVHSDVQFARASLRRLLATLP